MLFCQNRKQLFKKSVSVDLVDVLYKMSVVIVSIVAVVLGNRGGNKLFAHELPSVVNYPGNGANVPYRTGPGLACGIRLRFLNSIFAKIIAKSILAGEPVAKLGTRCCKLVNNTIAGKLNERYLTAENNSCSRNVLMHVEFANSKGHMSSVSTKPYENAVVAHPGVFENGGCNVGNSADSNNV